ncbi:4-hydroxythreonine-4-phosphate dehydrogenase PdxA [Halomonas cibimaris]|uniref:4-hydroxythreonine-4-phosphate dehydrogenase n=1 Tax=Halomonas cibimaris TaxID=657012 RepID=A0ABP7M282_9GAMM
MAESTDAPLPVAITTGEPAGIGPELTLSLAADAALPAASVAVGDPAMLAERATALGLEVTPVVCRPGEPLPAGPGVLPVWPVALRAPCTPGVLDPANAGYVIATLQAAVAACRAGQAAAMTTAPLHKGVIIDGGFSGFTGHTEWLRDACGVHEVVMLLATDRALHASRADGGGADLRVALVTTHLPLREVADAVTAERIQRVARILAHDLRDQFGIAAPRIAVCGLNPHAGEGGHLGREELDVVIPALDALRAEGLDIRGPYPADTLFTPRHLAGVDAVLAMYHDQGLAVLKYAGFGNAANITLGLPLVRTSVDHGTALDLAGKGVASPSSLGVAVALARRLADQRAG